MKQNKQPSWFGYVYVLKCGDQYKIGFSVKPRKRLRQFRTGSPFPIEVVFMMRTPYYKQVEKVLHNRLAAKRTTGEWFQLDDTDIEYLKSVDSAGRSPLVRAQSDAYADTFYATGDRELASAAMAECRERAPLLGCLRDW